MPEEKPPEEKPPEEKPPEEDDPALYDDATAFPVRLDTAAARELRVAANGSRSSALSSFPRFYGSYELGTDSGRAGTIKLGVRSTLARMASAEGAWVLRKRPRLGWELGMETADGDAAGLYSGRHWGGGGTISLANGMRADLRRSRYRRWRVRALETQEPLLEIRTAPIPTALTIATGRRSSLRSPDLDLLVLTACTVLILDAMWGPAGRESADGFVSS